MPCPGPDCKGMLHLTVPHICFHQQRGTPETIGEGLHPASPFRIGDSTPSQKGGVTALSIKSPSSSPFSSTRSMLSAFIQVRVSRLVHLHHSTVPLLTLEHIRGMDREHGPVARN